MKEWTPYDAHIKSFYNDDSVIHLIRTGHNIGDNELILIVHDDAYQLDTGVVEHVTPEMIKERYNIEL